MAEIRYIVIPNWDGPTGFQHYKDREPKWIKNYGTLMTKDEYLMLSFNRRGILHGLWLEYAASNRQLLDNTLSITRRLGGRVTRRDLDALNHAGFIEYSASKPLARRYQDASPEQSREDLEKDLKPPDQEVDLGTPPTALEDSSPLESLDDLAQRLEAQAARPGSEARLFEVLSDMDDKTPSVIRRYLEVLPARTIEEVREEVIHNRPARPTAYAVGILKRRANGKRAAA